MTEKYTPEKVAELITEAREKGRNNISKGITLNDRLADALTAVTAERDTAIRDLDAGFAESDHLSAKYYQRMRDAERDRDYMVINAQGLSRSGEQLKAERDHLRDGIKQAIRLNDSQSNSADQWEAMNNALNDALNGAALEQKGNDDE